MEPVRDAPGVAELNIAPARGRWEVDVEGRTLRFTNPDKVLWPQTGFTKGAMLEYYLAVAPYLLPYLAGRPVTLVRAPDGVSGWYWYQTSCPHPPEWLKTRTVASSGRAAKPIDYCTIEDAASLVWAVNLAAIELHPLLSATGAEEEAAVMVFDLDPGPPAGISESCRVALALRPILERSGLEPVVKTSGLAGLHVYAPLEQPAGFRAVRESVRRTGAALEAELAGLVTTSKRLAERSGRVLIDWSQNSPRRSMPAPYSLRIAAAPAVSTPLGWDEIEAAAYDPAVDFRFTPREVIVRLDKRGDLYTPPSRSNRLRRRHE